MGGVVMDWKMVPTQMTESMGEAITGAGCCRGLARAYADMLKLAPDPWIPVSVRLPDMDVLVLCSDAGWPHAKLRGKSPPVKVGGRDSSRGGDWMVWGASWNPTHWMPLPPPPKATT